MYTVINEPQIVRDIHNEYFKLINYYNNVKRPSAFIKYYNLVFDESPKENITNVTYDLYHKTRSRWDVYELTPTQIIGGIQNTPNPITDLKGQMLDSATSITLYTIENPRINDLVTFYAPVQSEEVLRVTNVRLQLNAAYSDTPVRWFEVDLETAPIKFNQMDELLKNKHFVYDLSQERNMLYEEYKLFVTNMQLLKDLLSKFNEFYVYEKDLYMADNKIPCETNELLFFVRKKFSNKYERLFEGIKNSLGYWDIFNFKNESIETINTTQFILKDYYSYNETTYELNEQETNLNRLLKLTHELKTFVKENKI